MGATKQAMMEELEAEGKEIIAECDSCGGGVTANRLNEMPFDGGEPAFIICEKCDDREAQLEAEERPLFRGQLGQ